MPLILAASAESSVPPLPAPGVFSTQETPAPSVSGGATWGWARRARSLCRMLTSAHPTLFTPPAAQPRVTIPTWRSWEHKANTVCGWVLAPDVLGGQTAQPQRASQRSFIGVHVCLLPCQAPTRLWRKGSSSLTLVINPCANHGAFPQLSHPPWARA